MNEVAKVDQPTNVIEATSVDQISAVMRVIERAATNPDVDITKMERLLEMQERILDRQAATDYAASMALAQAEMEPIARDAKNDQTNSSYATLAAVAKQATPIASRHGFSLEFYEGECSKDGHVRICVDVRHSGGHTKTRHVDLALDKTGIAGKVNKTDIHAKKSSITYGRGILFTMVFNLATEDDDGNAAGAAARDTITADQFRTLRDKIEQADADEDALCKHFKVEGLMDLRQDGFGYALALLDQKIAKAKADA